MKKKNFVVFSVTLVVTLALFAGGYYVLHTSFLQQKPQDGAVGADSEPDNTSSTAVQPDETVTFLLCGLDESEVLTDVIMVASLDVRSGRVNVLQIPRDTYVGIKRYPTGKINAVYGSGKGAETRIGALMDEIEYTFALHIDHYATVNLSGLRQIIDSMDGVTVDIPQTIYFTKNKVLQKGIQLLDGEKAEWFVRYRAGYVDGDIGRMRAQGLFMNACAKKALSMSRTQMLSVLTQNLGNITTDLTAAQLMEYYGALSGIGAEGLAFDTLEGSGLMHEGYSVFSLHAQKAADLLNERYRPYSDSVPAEELHIIELA
ncbi:MAG: LCP family protein [Acetanaerobacterium sp.]